MPVRTWGNANGNWRDFFGWQQGAVPNIFDDVTIETFAVAIDPGPDAEANSLALRNGAQLTTASNLNIASNFAIGSTSVTSTFTITAGTTTANTLVIGDQFSSSGPSGIVNVNGGTLNAANLTVGSAGEAILNIANGGTVSSGSTIIVGGGGANGFINIGGQSAPASAGTLNANVNLQSPGSVLTFRSNGFVVYGGAVSGSGSIAVRQANFGDVVTLTGNNTNSGTTTIESNSSLQIGNGGTDGRLGSGDIINNGGLQFFVASPVYNITNNISGIGGIGFGSNIQAIYSGINTYSGSTFINTGAQLRVDSQLGSGRVAVRGLLHLNNTMTVTGNIIDTGNLQTSNGTVVLTGTNTYSGTTTVLDGILQIGNGGTSGTLGSGAVITNGTIDFNRSDDETISHAISGSGGIAVSSVGTTTLTGANSYAGTTTINSPAILQIGNNDATGSLGSGAIITNGLLRLSRNDDETIANAISGIGNVSIRNGGVTTFTGTNTYTGSTTINDSATLRIGNGGTTGSLGTGAVTVAIDASLQFNRNDNELIANAISGSGSLDISSGGVTIFTGANTYSGATTINSPATLQIGNGGNIGTLGTGAVTNDGTLIFNRSDDEIIANDIHGSGGVVISSGGLTTFTGNNIYSGTTTIDGGSRLQITAGSIGSGNFIHNGNFLNFSLVGSHSIEQIIGNATQFSNGNYSLNGASSFAGGLLTVNNSSTLDLTGMSIQTLLARDIFIAGDSTIVLGGHTLSVTNATNPLGAGTIVGSGGADAIIYSAQGTGLTMTHSFTNWTDGVDSITLNGNDNDNVLTGAAANATIINGGGGSDFISGGAGGDVINGGSGFDTANYSGSLAGVTINLGVTFQIGGDAQEDQLTSIEGINGSSLADSLTGYINDDTLDGGGGIDTIDASFGGNDTIRGGADNDVIIFGNALRTTDAVDGGTGTDQLGISGNYAGANALVLGQLTLTTVEVLALLPGAGNSYDVTTHNNTVAAGVEMTIFAGNLGAGQNFTFNGSAETDGFFRTFGGLGTDTITGSGLSDGFYFGPGKWQAGDSVVGGGGTNDQLALDGDYTITVGASADVEVLVLLAGPVGTPNTFNITLSDVWIASGATKTVFGRNVTTAMTINGAAEANGNLTIFGGRGSDTLTSGGGNDTIYGLEGNDAVTGGLGVDTAVFQGTRATYSVVTGGGSVQIVDNDAVTDGNDGTDTVVGIEFARFSDQTISITSPIILDLDGGGVQTLSASQSSARFDMDGDGIGDDTSWFGRGEGLLFLDRDGNGTLSNTSEMSFTGDVANARSDLEGLAAFDSNGDGQLSSADARFRDFKIWRDRDGDGIVDRREIMTLRQAGVRSLSLSGTANNGTYALGDTAVVNTGSFTRTNGRSGGFIDAVLTAVSSKAGTAASNSATIDAGLFAGSFADAAAQVEAPAQLEIPAPAEQRAPYLIAAEAVDPSLPLMVSVSDAGGAEAASFDTRVALMTQDMVTFGADRSAITDSDRWRRNAAVPVAVFAA